MCGPQCHPEPAYNKCAHCTDSPLSPAEQYAKLEVLMKKDLALVSGQLNTLRNKACMLDARLRLLSQLPQAGTHADPDIAKCDEFARLVKHMEEYRCSFMDYFPAARGTKGSEKREIVDDDGYDAESSDPRGVRSAGAGSKRARRDSSGRDSQ